MHGKPQCPRCGRSLGADAPEGLCPRCMIALGLATETLPEGGAVPTRTAGEADAPPPPLRRGDRLGRYRIERRLGHGGMGVVYEAEETDSGRRVALKILRRQLDSPQDRARFLREGRVAASINHPNCVYVFGTEEIEGTPTIAMEFIGGSTLAHRLDREGPLPIGRAVDAMLQVIEGLEAAQAVGILHRDIKPSNCFEDNDGRIKIGDFGLSISTLSGGDAMITEAGAVVGTPAYCSPEQLRGEELGMRSDLYAVGVTLYQLLTGRLPFEGKTMPQLVANTLEKPAPSPRAIRRDIPPGLAKAILRCLEKQPADRFRSYADLRRALEPFGSAAPRPGTLGLRFLAGFLDMLLLGAVGQVAVLLVFGDPLNVLDRMLQDLGRTLWFVLPWFAAAIAYYALSEWRWGATLGKAICRLRVVRPDRAYPSLSRAVCRAGIYQVFPVLPYWITAGIDPELLFGNALGTYALSGSFYGLTALLFVTARRRNGFAAVHDLLTDTRLVALGAVAARTGLPVVEAPPKSAETCPRIGPFHVLRTLDAAEDATWVEGYDLRLLRRVLIRTVPAGASPLPASVRLHTRVGRLRWLAGRREGADHWDAFEGAGGDALCRVAAAPQPWSRVRYWLTDLAEELQAAAQDESPPPPMRLDRVWITGTGRAKILDVPAPGGGGEPADAPSRQVAASVPAFLDRVASAALGGMASSTRPAAEVARPLALHAREFLARLPALPDAAAVVAALRPLLRRTAELTRVRRAVPAAVCAGLPLLLSAGALFGISVSMRWQREHPQLMAMQQVTQLWNTKHLPFMPEDALPGDRLFGVYIAAHFQDVIADEETWNSPLARSLINGRSRAFAEESARTLADVAESERAEAETALQGIAAVQVESGGTSLRDVLPTMVAAGLILYVALPAVLAALLFRGGPALRGAGIAFVRRDGRRASRLRLCWRALVAWIPVAAVAVVCIGATHDGSPGWALVAVVALAALILGSLGMPQRSLPDRLSGAWPVPR
jgi:eukaryotic-like serine/threonine-protein kinase